MHLLRLQWLHSMDDQPAEARLPSAEESRPIPEDAPWERAHMGTGEGGGFYLKYWKTWKNGILDESCVFQTQLSSRIPLFGTATMMEFSRKVAFGKRNFRREFHFFHFSIL